MPGMHSPKPIVSLFTPPPALGDSVGEVVSMKFNEDISRKVFKKFCWVVMIVAVVLVLTELRDVNTVFFISLCSIFAWLGSRRAGEKTIEAAKAKNDVIASAVIATLRTTVDMSRDIVAIIKSIPVAVPRIEYRTNPPAKIKAPTLYPRLVATPWPVRA